MKTKKSFLKMHPILQRLHSFGGYILAAFLSLINPIMVYKLLYEVLKEQFEKDSENHS